jgi:hypothetical protein
MVFLQVRLLNIQNSPVTPRAPFIRRKNGNLIVVVQ